MGLSVVILAAGASTRMHSSIPKGLHALAGTPILTRVINNALAIKPDNVYVIYGKARPEIVEHLLYLPVQWVEQDEQLGTGHAVLQALPEIPDDHQVLTIVGDIPLVSPDILSKLVSHTTAKQVGLISADALNPHGLGRLIRNASGEIEAVVEEKDATPAQKVVHEINSGIIISDADYLKEKLPTFTANNAQGEVYLTDIIHAAVEDKRKVVAVKAERWQEVSGVNTREQLTTLERYFQETQAEKIMMEGVTLRDPKRFDVRGEASFGNDVTIDVNVILEGKVTIGNNVTIGPNVFLQDVTIADGATIHANSVVVGAAIEASCSIGPFARIRQGTAIKAGAKVGNFVEVKNTELGENSKASHLSYLGDATIGANVNIGAGVITCNYDGVNKHRTVIEDGAFVGSDTQLVAPVAVGKNATIGAGSTITKDAPADQLTLSRDKQRSLVMKNKDVSNV